MIALDHNDLKHGFAVGKSHALAEWAHRKEQREFAALCKRLGTARWYRRVKAAGGEQWARMLAAWRVHNRAASAKRSAAKRTAFDRTLAVATCPTCGDRFVRAWGPGRRAKHCSKRCSNAASKAARGPDVVNAYQRQLHRAKVLATRTPRTCRDPACGAELPAVDANGAPSRALYCTGRSCRNRAAWTVRKTRAQPDREHSPKTCAV